MNIRKQHEADPARPHRRLRAGPNSRRRNHYGPGRENQTVSKEKRKEWVFHQKQLLRMHRGNGKIAREERREYDVMPDEKGLKKELTKLDGKYERNGKYIAYDQPGFSYKEVDIDGDLINDMSNDMIGDQSRDGIGKNLFPLTAEEQAKHTFRLVGSESYRGRRCTVWRSSPSRSRRVRSRSRPVLRCGKAKL
jgi:hypothetical protein